MDSLSERKRDSFFQLRLAPAWADAVACVAGALLPLAFSPFDLFPLAIFLPAFLFLLWRDITPARAARRGFLFGMGLFGVGVSWVYVSMHNFGNMPAPLAGFAVLLFVAGLSVYPALLGWLQARFFNTGLTRHRLFVLPALWVVFEWLRGWFLTGFPWLHLGYSQVSSPLAGYAPWLGVYGVSLAAALSAGIVAQSVHEPGKALPRYLPLLLLLWAGGWFAGQMEWVQPVNGPVRVSLIQGNVPLEIKWQPKARESIMERYVAMSSQAPKSDLIVWPEAALPVYLDEIETSYLDSLRRLSQAGKVDFVFGVVDRDRNTRDYYNSVVSVSAQPGIYRKRHLVPFGEYPPLEPLFSWLMRHLQIPMSDFSAGPKSQAPLFAAGQRIGVSVCYEDAFGEEVIDALPQATLLVNVSEDAWFGHSFAPYQRIQMARMRALETGRPLLRAANTGPSVVVDHRGMVLARSPAFQADVLSATVQPMQGVTPYIRFGNVPVMLLSLAGLTMLIRRRRKVPIEP